MGEKREINSDDYLKPYRLEGESFEHYKERQRRVKKLVKAYMQGRIKWNPELKIPNGVLPPHRAGSYEKGKHGKL